MISNVTIRTTRNNRRLATYTVNGGRAASFVPSSCEDAIAARVWLTAHRTGGRDAAAVALSTLSQISAPAEPTLTVEERLAELERELDGILAIALWTKVPGKERVYLDLLSKSNGGRTWNGGRGASWSICIHTGRVTMTREWAGAKTRAGYSDLCDETIARIKAILSI